MPIILPKVKIIFRCQKGTDCYGDEVWNLCQVVRKRGHLRGSPPNGWRQCTAEPKKMFGMVILNCYDRKLLELRSWR